MKQVIFTTGHVLNIPNQETARIRPFAWLIVGETAQGVTRHYAQFAASRASAELRIRHHMQELITDVHFEIIELKAEQS